MIRPLGKLRDHYWLVLRMASKIGVNLVSAQNRGQLSSCDWAEMVTACRGCEWAPRCNTWLHKAEQTPCAPATCVNRRKFELLRTRETG